MTGSLLLGVSLAGGLGACLRFVVDGALTTRWQSPFPYATLLINVTGSLLLGVLTGLALLSAAPPSWSVILGSGFCGGFTTFSTTSFASARLAGQRRPGLAAVNAVGTLVLSVLAAGAGLALSTL